MPLHARYGALDLMYVLSIAQLFVTTLARQAIGPKNPVVAIDAIINRRRRAIIGRAVAPPRVTVNTYSATLSSKTSEMSVRLVDSSTGGYPSGSWIGLPPRRTSTVAYRPSSAAANRVASAGVASRRRPASRHRPCERRPGLLRPRFHAR